MSTGANLNDDGTANIFLRTGDNAGMANSGPGRTGLNLGKYHDGGTAALQREHTNHVHQSSSNLLTALVNS